MSLSRRIFDLARSNLNALLDRAGGESSVDDLSDDELEAELQRRRERRKREDEERAAAARAADNARARGAANGAIPPPRQQRQQKPPSSFTFGPSDKRLRELYAQLETPYGAPFSEVKTSFRRLMRKYHPDLHIGNPQMHKTATQLTMSLTQAYNELELHLVGGPNKSPTKR
jgi:DnaJ-domain-containing protein 1